jgi:hypothetical protein
MIMNVRIAMGQEGLIMMSDYLPEGWTQDKIEESYEFQRKDMFLMKFKHEFSKFFEEDEHICPDHILEWLETNY